MVVVVTETLAASRVADVENHNMPSLFCSVVVIVHVVEVVAINAIPKVRVTYRKTWINFY